MLVTILKVGFGASVVSKRRMAAGCVPVSCASFAFDRDHCLQRHRLRAGGILVVVRRPGQIPRGRPQISERATVDSCIFTGC